MISNSIDGMLRIIEGCMGDSPPYCTAACPMHTDAKKYIKQIADGKYQEALATIRDKLFLPKTPGLISTHPCEETCRRDELSQPQKGQKSYREGFGVV